MAETRYLPYGEDRWTAGDAQPTDFTFTGQRVERGFGLMDYKARYYDPRLGRFISADTVVPEPGNPQALNRYSYVNNSPLRYRDPSGHYECEDAYGDCKPRPPSLPPLEPPEEDKILFGGDVLAEAGRMKGSTIQSDKAYLYAGTDTAVSITTLALSNIPTGEFASSYLMAMVGDTAQVIYDFMRLTEEWSGTSVRVRDPGDLLFTEKK